MKREGNILLAHYEWIAAAVAAAALVFGGVLFVGALGTDPEARADAASAQIKRTPPGGEKVMAADLTDFTRTSKLAKNPTSLMEVADDKGSYLASERRVFCEKCQAAVSADVKACPACGFEFKEEVKVVLDADGDGLPDVWEKKYGLNPTDPNDAALDKDADGFTNLEEFTAKTDPTDRNDHPDYLDSLKIELPLKETKLPFYFTGVMKMPTGLKYSFKNPSRTNLDDDRGNYSVYAGEDIGKTGYVPKEYVPKTKEETMGGGMKKRKDISEAIVVRKSDGKTLAMPIDKRGVAEGVQAKLVYTRGTVQTFEVVVGSTIDLNGTKFTVKEIKGTDKNGATVALVDVKTGKVSTLATP